MRFLESLPNVEIVTETCKFSMLSSNDASNEIPSKSCSKYYSANDFQLLNISNNFNIFHSNINGLESKLDNLNEFLSGPSSKIDVIALTETSEKEDTGFLNNVDFQMFHTGSKWIYTHNNVHDSFKDFYTKLEGSVNRHALLKSCLLKK